ncbi:MAG: DedA family protein [Candidatus Sulfobium sp.]|jgi:membrane protein DedA with SNARE-associated domain
MFLGNFPYLGLFAPLILGGLGVPLFPEDATLILCGFLIRQDIVKVIPALLVVYVGVLIADFIIYSFGRKYGRMVVCHRWFRRFLSRDKLDSLEKTFERKGVFFVLFGRQFIGLRAQIFLVSGIMKMNRLKFVLADAFAVTFTIAALVSIGYAGGHGLRDIGINTSQIVFWGILAFVSSATGYLFLRFLRDGRSLGSSSQV